MPLDLGVAAFDDAERFDRPLFGPQRVLLFGDRLLLGDEQRSERRQRGGDGAEKVALALRPLMRFKGVYQKGALQRATFIQHGRCGEAGDTQLGKPRRLRGSGGIVKKSGVLLTSRARMSGVSAGRPCAKIASIAGPWGMVPDAERAWNMPLPI